MYNNIIVLYQGTMRVVHVDVSDEGREGGREGGRERER